MSPPRPLAFLVSILASMTLAPAGEGVQRQWTSQDGAKKLEARFVKLRGEMVTLQPLKDPKPTTFPLKLLSTPDQELARRFGEFFPEGAPAEEIPVLSLFHPGASMDEVEKIVKGCKELTGGLPKELLGRTGLNGVYTIKVAGEPFQLFFGWDESNNLLDVSLHSGPVNEEGYETQARKVWAKYRQILLARHGVPNPDLGYPSVDSFHDGQVMFSDWWQEEGGNYGLGMGRAEGKVAIIIRLTKQPPKTVRK